MSRCCSPAADRRRRPAATAAAPAAARPAATCRRRADRAATRRRRRPRTYLLTLDAGAFPPTSAYPSALVYLPRGFDPTPPLSVVVFIHGFSNCVENVVRDAGGECTPDGGTRAAYCAGGAARGDQQERAPARARDRLRRADRRRPATSAPPTASRRCSTETLADLRRPAARRRRRRRRHAHRHVALGRLQAAAGIASQGRRARRRDRSPRFALRQHRRLRRVGQGGRRRQALRRRLHARRRHARQLAGDGHARAGAGCPRRSSSTIAPPTRSTDAQYAHELIFKLSGLAHDGVPAYYFGKVVGTSVLAPKK